MTRVYNFSAGPSQLPTEVLQKCAAELMEYGISGQSVMEMSHRSSSFLEIIETTELRLRSLLRIPKHYQVLFLQGGASLQFTMVPMNLLKPGGKAGRDPYWCLDEKSDCGWPQDRRLPRS